MDRPHPHVPQVPVGEPVHVERLAGAVLLRDGDAAVAGASATTRFVHDGDALALEHDGAGTLLRRYVDGNGEDDPLLWYEGAGLSDKRSLQVDHQGSIVSVADASGNPLEIDSYDEYGTRGTANTARFQFTGQVWLGEAGLYYYKARSYDPRIGRFLQVDPIGYKDQANLYAYVANDPVNGRDPTGTEGVVDDVVNWGKMVANDIVDLGKGLARGDFEWALGGMPPTLSGGANMATAPIRAVNAVRVSLAIRTSVRIEAKAGSLAAQAGRNSVNIKTPGGFSRVDLAGKAHYSKELGRDVATPHVQSYRENIVDGVVKSVSRVGDAVPATMKDLKAVEDVLKNMRK